MSQRDKWEFEYTASMLAKAVRVKIDRHQGRLEWWQDKRFEVIRKIKDVGMDVHESQAVSKSPGYGSAQITIDATLQKDLNETVDKVREHTELVRQYSGWFQVFDGNPESRLRMNYDDYLFFFGT